MLVARVDEEVRIGAGVDAGLEERERVLRHTGVVVVIVNQQQFAPQLPGQGLEVARFVSVGIGLRHVHVALAVHHLVVSPVDDRPACHADLVQLRIAQHQGRSHVPPEAPPVHADTVAVHVRQGLEPLGRLGLVFALLNAEATERAVLESQAPVSAAPVVNGEEDVTPVRHVEVPAAGGVHPVGSQHLCVRPAVDVNDDRVLLPRVEVCRLQHAPVECRRIIGRLHRAHLHRRHDQPTEGVGSSEEAVRTGHTRLGRQQVDGTGNVRRGVVVYHIRARSREPGVVHTLPLVQQDGVSSSRAYLIYIALHGRLLRGREINLLLFLIESKKRLNQPLSPGELHALIRSDELAS